MFFGCASVRPSVKRPRVRTRSSLLIRHLKNRLCDFHNIYNLRTVGDES